MCVCVRERERVCVCVCVRERDTQRETESVCVREGACVCSVLSCASNDLRASHSLVQVSGLLKNKRAVVVDHD